MNVSKFCPTVATNVMSFKQFGEALGVELNYLFRLALYNC